jgi:hypothetical protein
MCSRLFARTACLITTAICMLWGIRTSAQPVNDSCANVTPVLILSGSSYLFTGDNTGGTFPGDAVPGSSMAAGSFPLVWHAFELQDCGDVVIDYCGNTPLQSVVSQALITTCPADDPVILADVQSTSQCGDGNTTLTYLGLPAGQYYIPIYCVFSPIGPYQVKVTVLPCSGGPPNDECAGAYPLSVFAPADCPGSASFGNTALGSQTSPPPACLPGLSYSDLWYHFNSGPDTLIDVHAEVVTASQIGIEVLDACGGLSIDCDTGSVVEDTVHLTAFTEYWIRVFTQTDSEVPGTFGICLSTVSAAVDCDGGTVSTAGDSLVTICKEGIADPLGFTTTSSSSQGYSYFLCDTAGIVLAALNGDSLDADTLALGTYFIYGYSFNGSIELPFLDEPIDSIMATGACGEMSINPVELNVAICSGLSPSPAAALRLFPNPNDGSFTMALSRSGRFTLRLLDLSGRQVLASSLMLENGRGRVQLPTTVAEGSYVLELDGEGGSHIALLVVQR